MLHRTKIAVTATAFAAVAAVAAPLTGVFAGDTDTPAAQGSSVAAPSAQPITETGFAEGYEFPWKLNEMLAWQGNQEVFRAEVLGVGNRTRVAPPDLGGDEIVYRSVEVRVTKSYKGSLTRGEVVNLRDVGGEADGLRFNYDAAAPADTYTPGAKLLVLTSGPYDLGDGVTARTPNFLFLRKGGSQVELTQHNPEGLGRTPVKDAQIDQVFGTTTDPSD